MKVAFSQVPVGTMFICPKTSLFFKRIEPISYKIEGMLPHNVQNLSFGGTTTFLDHEQVIIADPQEEVEEVA